ncbi:amino acid adenylation domain-containing protein [Streptomyces sp. AN091965]|uniref:amino acid adenylation domain-containing protein n=1 Tax=Streptomyces sp. AN091965 TaxID=2927803 RepID=UPI001F60F632|nr:amino acid adenylation domain-containing protein [Streptomyces sp. AN091965]MCI3934555.1 amino acid adenylation domain-containing protein [Streptomyces sp. AN091965]
MATTTGTPPRAAGGARPSAALHDLPPFRHARPEQGHACHAVIVRLPRAVQPAQVHQRWDEALRHWPALHDSRLWETAVPAPPEASCARERTRREALRPVREASPPLRAVLLRYADDSADLVLAARRSRVPHAVLDQVADLLATGSAPGPPPALPDGAEPPPPRCADLPWGLPDPGRAGTVQVRPLTLPEPAGGGGRRLVIGAVALALARYSGAATAEVGRLDPGSAAGPGAAVTVEGIDEDRSLADYLTQVDAALGAAPDATARTERPGVGVVFSPGRYDRIHLPFQTPPFPCTLQVMERADGSVEASCWFDEGVLCPSVAAAFCACVERLAGCLAEGAGEGGAASLGAVPLTALPLLDAEETAHVLRLGGGGRPRPGVGDVRIEQRFEEVARARPDAVAVTGDGTELTYRQLDERADAVAAGLRALGLPPAGKVGVCLDRDAPLVIALLGVLKAGYAYVPMDRGYPPERMRYIAENARVPVVITDHASFPASAGVRTVGLDDLATATDRGHRVPPTRSAADPAYVIYTSGSTGRPKGVVVPHHNVLSLLSATAPEFSFGPEDVWTLFHSAAFDFSVWEIWGCLLTGGRLVVVPYWTARDADGFRALLLTQRVTVLNQTPSAFSALAQADRGAQGDLLVRLLIFGGEPLDVKLLAPWFARYSPARCHVVNMFGITETTVHVTAHSVTPADVAGESRSVGRPLPGWSVSVRDPRGRVLPPGAAGEIHVGGAGVAHGYLGNPELTRQHFVLDDVSDERLYRSGDRGRLRPDGRLDHLGRLDDQVKIRGHRIEPGEIRSVLTADPRVGAAVVTVTQASAADRASSRIDGYVVLVEPCDPRQILADARRLLPDYMTPTTLTAVPSIPLTANGKPDLARLPAPATRAGQHSGGVRDPGPGPDDVAGRVLAVWSHCLDTDATADDNFFELGGNSLLILRVITAMRERGLPRVAPRDFYVNSTASRFIKLVEERCADGS